MDEDVISNYLDYTKKRFWHDNNVRRLSVGYIVKCDEGDDYGVIYGYKQHFEYSDSSMRTWMYFFSKEKDFSLGKYTIVSFLKSPHEYNKREENKATDIKVLSSYRIIDTSDEKIRGENKCRELNWTCYDIEWDLVEKGESFIVLQEKRWAVLMYPIIDNENKAIEYHSLYGTIEDGDYLTSLLSCFVGSVIFKDFNPFPNKEYIVQKIAAIKQYVDHFNLEKNLLKFYVGESGRYFTRPGKDEDDACITNYLRTTCKDIYLIDIAQLYVTERWESYSGFWYWDGNYDRIDEEKTKIKRDEIKVTYNKDAHFLYLIDAFLRQVHEKQNCSIQCCNKLNLFLEDDDHQLFEKDYNQNNYKILVSNYNYKHSNKNKEFQDWIEEYEEYGFDMSNIRKIVEEEDL